MGRPRRNWTPEEDALLRQTVNNALKNSRPLLWREFAKSVPGRSNKDCRRRWWNSLADGTAKGSWSEEEDERLIEAVRRHGTNWSQVARDVGSRNPDQCSSHWSHVLDPHINFCDWTPTEDEHLLHAVLTHGTNWTTIAASHVPNRTTLALKNRYSTLRLRHENSKKAKEGAAGKTLGSPPSLSPDTLTAANKERRSDKNTQIHPNANRKANDADGEIVEAEEEDGDEDEDDDGEEEQSDPDDTSQFSNVQFMANCNDAIISAIDLHSKDSNMATSNAWASSAEQSGLSSPGPSRTGTAWPDNSTVDPSQFQNTFSLGHPSLYPGLAAHDFFGSVQDPNGTNPGGVGGAPLYATYDLNTGVEGVDIVHTPPTHRFPPNQAGAESSPSQASKGGGGMSPISQCNPATTYQVSINMVCTGVQLEAVLVNVASAGTGVTMKIDPSS